MILFKTLLSLELMNKLICILKIEYTTEQYRPERDIFKGFSVNERGFILRIQDLRKFL